MSGLQAIKARGLAKRYPLQTITSPLEYQTLAEKLAGVAVLPWKMAMGQTRSSQREWFWALNDIDLDIEHGEVIGIIGRNGNGKSTLLKILSKITSPMRGFAEMTGRVCSLLEVGTGFHPELTGSENIYLNGSILGMTRREIQKKFDQIVAFSEVEQFLHMPVKRYSSGMRVRLAFSVAAHLDPDILIVDEVLAVGDLAFQKKCLNRMSEFASTGRTILFVSHSMPAIELLCRRTIQISGGRIVADGPTESVVPEFIKSMISSDNRLYHAETDLTHHSNRVRGSQKILQQLRIVDAAGHPSCGLLLGSPCTFQVRFDPSQAPTGLAFQIAIRTEQGERVGMLHSRVQSRVVTNESGTTAVHCTLDELPLLPGEYMLDVSVGTWDRTIDCVEEAARITVLPSDYFHSGELPNTQHGFIALRSRWAIEQPDVPKPSSKLPILDLTETVASLPTGESQLYDWR